MIDTTARTIPLMVSLDQLVDLAQALLYAAPVMQAVNETSDEALNQLDELVCGPLRHLEPTLYAASYAADYYRSKP